jgi:hypothetical protein
VEASDSVQVATASGSTAGNACNPKIANPVLQTSIPVQVVTNGTFSNQTAGFNNSITSNSTNSTSNLTVTNSSLIPNNTPTTDNDSQQIANTNDPPDFINITVQPCNLNSTASDDATSDLNSTDSDDATSDLNSTASVNATSDLNGTAVNATSYLNGTASDDATSDFVRAAGNLTSTASVNATSDLNGTQAVSDNLTSNLNSTASANITAPSSDLNRTANAASNSTAFINSIILSVSNGSNAQETLNRTAGELSMTNSSTLGSINISSTQNNQTYPGYSVQSNISSVNNHRNGSTVGNQTSETVVGLSGYTESSSISSWWQSPWFWVTLSLSSVGILIAFIMRKSIVVVEIGSRILTCIRELTLSVDVQQSVPARVQPPSIDVQIEIDELSATGNRSAEPMSMLSPNDVRFGYIHSLPPCIDQRFDRVEQAHNVFEIPSTRAALESSSKKCFYQHVLHHNGRRKSLSANVSEDLKTVENHIRHHGHRPALAHTQSESGM